jgi:hypothetical protein
MPTPDLFKSQFFMDDSWIAESWRLGRVWHKARKRPEPVLRAEAPWEGAPVMYGTVLFRDGRFRMWYVSWCGAFRGAIAYAESPDGVFWTKPALGLVEVNGSKANNLILARPDLYVDNLGVIDDPADKKWPLKMIYWMAGDGHKSSGLAAARSADGIHWDFSLGMVLPHWGDRTNMLPERDAGKYVVYGRIPRMMAAPRSCRTVARTESRDLRRWSEPELVIKPDPEDDPRLQIYSATVFKHESLYLGFIERMNMAPDVLDPELCFSHDGRTWQRTRARQPFIERGPACSWDGYWVNLPSSAPVRRDGQLLFHYSGRSTGHTHHDAYRLAGIGLASLRVDGFCSLQAVEKDGWLVTPPLRWVKGELHVNLDPRRDITTHPGYGGGQLLAELRDPAGRPIPGFTFDDCLPLLHNTAHSNRADGTLPVKWKEEKRLAALAGRRVRIAFRLRDAHLYAFKAVAPAS